VINISPRPLSLSWARTGTAAGGLAGWPQSLRNATELDDVALSGLTRDRRTTFFPAALPASVEHLFPPAPDIRTALVRIGGGPA